MHSKTIVATVIALLACPLSGLVFGDPANEAVFVSGETSRDVRFEGKTWQSVDGCLECGGTDNYLHVEKLLGPGDFRVSMKMTILNLDNSAASLVISGSHFGFEGGSGTMFTEGALLGRKSLGRPAVETGKPFSMEVTREAGKLRFIIDGRVVHETDVDPKLSVSFGLRPWRSTMRVSQLAAEGNLIAAPEPPFQTDVFASGTEGYDTFRIPAVITTLKGTLLAFCEGRKAGRGDSGDIDIVLRRSEDDGQTWSELQLVADESTNTIGNPCPVVDQSTGRIWLPLTWNLGTDGEGQIMSAESEKPRLVYITHSDDDGCSWAPITEISETTRRPHWRWYATGPGNAVQLTRGKYEGRLVVPSDHSDHSDPNVHPYRSHVIVSDDQGRTWRIGGVAGEKTNESTVVELSDGRLLLNMRAYHGENRRAVATSDDGGETWSEVTLDDALVEPVCQANMLRYTFPELDGKSRILFSNPASTGRQMMTVRVSYDEGQTWPVAKLVYPGSSAYSCMTVLSDMSIGLLYERDGYRKISFTRFDLQWLSDGRDRLRDSPENEE